ncbi:MAG: MgtC/SapB family protein [Phycisphaerae bacterium]|nr:MgtC/SapB family protein [Phycisphaerae bacterium]
MRFYGVILLRLALAMLLAVIIGADRERHDKPAGLRTIAMVGVGGCLFGLLATMAFVGDASSRVVQGLVTGVGFLGAGTIIKERSRIEGLTTAATIWTVSGIGLAVGMGWYALAIMAAMAVVFVLTALRHFEARRRKAAGEPPAPDTIED